MVAKKTQTVVRERFCKDCAHSTPDTKFVNLSVNGEPTLLSCPYKEWRMVITTNEVCNNYKIKQQ